MTRANDMCKNQKRRRTCEARITLVALFLDLDIQTIKVMAKDMPRQPGERHRTPQEINMVTKMVPRGLPRALRVRSMDPKNTPRGSQRLPKGDQNHRKSILEAIWATQEN